MNFTAKLRFWGKRRLQRTLPAEQLEVLVLVCVEDLTYAEAATVLNVPVETVVSRLLQARRSLIAFGQAGLWPSPNFSERRDLNAGSMEAGGSPLLPVDDQ